MPTFPFLFALQYALPEEVEGEWRPDEQGVVSSGMIKETKAKIETCPVCGFREVVDFQQQRQSVPVIPSIFLN